MGTSGHVPVLVVHGIWDSEERIATLTQGLIDRGLPQTRAFTFHPRDGSAPLSTLGLQVQGEVESLKQAHGVERVDLVGFSMGALVSRYYIQRLSGRDHTRRFVSISGPHHGTLMAYGLSHDGVRDMRPGSPFLRDLERHENAATGAANNVETHVVYTPFDLTILPADSSELPGARTTKTFPVAFHRWMIKDRRVLDHVAALLTSAEPA